MSTLKKAAPEGQKASLITVHTASKLYFQYSHSDPRYLAGYRRGDVQQRRFDLRWLPPIPVAMAEKGDDDMSSSSSTKKQQEPRKRRPGGGRKKLPPEQLKKSSLSRVSIDFYLEDMERITDAARSAGMSRSAWMRSAVLAALPSSGEK